MQNIFVFLGTSNYCLIFTLKDAFYRSGLTFWICIDMVGCVFVQDGCETSTNRCQFQSADDARAQ